MKCLFLLILAYISIGCSHNSADLCQVQTPGATAYIHSFGDSITVGGGADHFCNGYQALLTQDLGMNGDNMAVSGSPLVGTPEYGAMMKMMLNIGTEFVGSFESTPSVDISSLLTGHNDIILFGTDAAHFAEFQYEFQESLIHLSSLSKMVLVGTTLYGSDFVLHHQSGNYYRSTVDMYVNAEKAIISSLQAKGYPLVLVDTNAIFDPDTMTTNDIHPNDYGHQALAQAFFSAYQGAL